MNAPPEPSTNQLLTRTEAAEMLGVRPQTLAAWAHHGRYKLPFVKVGRCVRYSREALDQWTQDRTRCQTK